MTKNSKIYVAGHNGMVGSALVRVLKSTGYKHLLLRNRSELDLSDNIQVNTFFKTEKPDYVFLAAAKVGGIHANKTYPAEFIYSNLSIQTNVIHAAHQQRVKKLVFLGSSCIYPKYAKQPIKETELLTGILEPTNEAYAIAKIAGLKMCQAYKDQYGDNFVSVMPTNLYGPNDTYDKMNSHVIPALLMKFHEAKIKKSPSVTVWGSGKPRREFMHVDDMAKATLLVMTDYNDRETINIGVGEDVSIKKLASLVAQATGYRGDILFDTSMPDGTPRKQLDITKLKALGFSPSIRLDEGLATVYKDFVAHHS